MRSFNCANAPPLTIDIDIDTDFFKHQTRFRTDGTNKLLYILDTFFTVVIIHQLVIVYWRGTWGLFDLYLFPENPTHSAIATLIISFILHIVVTLLQPVLNALYQKSKMSNHPVLYATFLEQSLYTVSNLADVTHWRGVWILSEVYLLLPDNPDLGCVVTHLFGLSVLMLLLCGQSVTMSGCEIDGDAEPELGCYLPNKYFRYFAERKARECGKTVLVNRAGVSVRDLYGERSFDSNISAILLNPKCDGFVI